MIKVNTFKRTLIGIGALIGMNSAQAEILDCGVFLYEPTYVIPGDTTVSCNLGGNYQGSLTNAGELILAPLTMLTVSGSIDNYGSVKSNYELILSGRNALITNRPTGIINSSGWLFIRSSSRLENYGIVNLARTYGDNTVNENIFNLSGTVNNYGTFRFDTNVSSLTGFGAFNNQGNFEVTSNASYPASYSSTTFNYVQSKGETEINGSIKIRSVNISGGKLAGSGTLEILSGTTPIVGANAVISPSGTLTIKKTDLILGGSLDAELTGPEDYDQLKVVGNLNLNNTRLNVLLRSNYVPEPGTPLTIVSANSIVGTFSTLNLPELPAGSCWTIDYGNTAVTLEATTVGGNCIN